MKPKFKKLKKTIVFVLILILLWNCASEEIGVKNNEVATKTFLEEINQVKYSLDELKKNQKINTILNDALKGIKQNNSNQKKLNNPQKIQLSNTLSKFSRLDYTSYTIPIINSNQNSTSFQNIIIETDDLREAAYLITYTPNNNYQQAKYAHTIYDDQTIYYIANSNIECLYYKRKTNKISNNGSNQKTVSSTNPLIEESLIDCVVAFYPGHNCTAGGNHAVGQSCSGTGGQRAEGPVVYVSCRNIPEAPPTIPRNPSGNEGISPDTSLHGASGGTPLELDPLANYPKNWICMNPPQCSDLIPYTPILTIPMDDPYNFYSGVFSLNDINILTSAEYEEAKKSIDFYLNDKTSTTRYNDDTKAFVNWTLDFFKANKNTTFEQFQNWFITPREGKDGDYDATFWENPNLIFPQQQLPTFQSFDDAYPRTSGSDLATLIGGDVLTLYNKYPSVVRGFCALKVSRGLNYSGITIPHIVTTNKEPGTVLGSDGKYYFLNAKALNKWMQKTFGISPSNPNHKKISGDQSGKNGENFTLLTAGIKGIYSMVSTNSEWASGHADLINNGTCVFGCHFYDIPPAPIDYIDIWILN